MLDVVSGYFSGQTGYGYRSFEAFIDAVRQIEAGSATAEVIRGRTPETDSVQKN